jgi:hypothetical protein
LKSDQDRAQISARAPEVRERSKKGKEENSSFLSSLGIDLSKVQVEIKLKKEDRELIENTLKEISEKVDYRWKVTQGIMVVALLLSAGAQIVNWVS